MDRDRLLEYARGYDRRRASRNAAARAGADRAREALPGLAEMCRSFGARRVRLFGSLARGESGARDIDLAVDGVPAARFFELYGAILGVSPLMVDLVDLVDCPGPLRDAIEREGIEL